jgi:Rha family phage regulatory protein
LLPDDFRRSNFGLADYLDAQGKARPMVSSLQVAELYEREHKDVLRVIQRLVIPKEFRRRNFKPSSCLNSQNKSQPMYWMTRDGFWMLSATSTRRPCARRRGRSGAITIQIYQLRSLLKSWLGRPEFRQFN